MEKQQVSVRGDLRRDGPSKERTRPSILCPDCPNQLSGGMEEQKERKYHPLKILGKENLRMSSYKTSAGLGKLGHWDGGGNRYTSSHWFQSRLQASNSDAEGWKKGLRRLPALSCRGSHQVHFQIGNWAWITCQSTGQISHSPGRGTFRDREESARTLKIPEIHEERSINPSLDTGRRYCSLPT